MFLRQKRLCRKIRVNTYNWQVLPRLVQRLARRVVGTNHKARWGILVRVRSSVVTFRTISVKTRQIEVLIFSSYNSIPCDLWQGNTLLIGFFNDITCLLNKVRTRAGALSEFLSEVLNLNCLTRDTQLEMVEARASKRKKLITLVTAIDVFCDLALNVERTCFMWKRRGYFEIPSRHTPIDHK